MRARMFARASYAHAINIGALIHFRHSLSPDSPSPMVTRSNRRLLLPYNGRSPDSIWSCMMVIVNIFQVSFSYDKSDTSTV